MTKSQHVTRRNFVKSAAAAGVAAPWIVPGSALGLDGGTPANSRITIGGIGVGKRGGPVLG